MAGEYTVANVVHLFPIHKRGIVGYGASCVGLCVCSSHLIHRLYALITPEQRTQGAQKEKWTRFRARGGAQSWPCVPFSFLFLGQPWGLLWRCLFAVHERLPTRAMGLFLFFRTISYPQKKGAACALPILLENAFSYSKAIFFLLAQKRGSKQVCQSAWFPLSFFSEWFLRCPLSVMQNTTKKRIVVREKVEKRRDKDRQRPLARKNGRELTPQRQEEKEQHFVCAPQKKREKDRFFACPASGPRWVSFADIPFVAVKRKKKFFVSPEQKAHAIWAATVERAFWTVARCAVRARASLGSAGNNVPSLQPLDSRLCDAGLNEVDAAHCQQISLR